MHRLLWILPLVTLPEAVKVPLLHNWKHVLDEEQLRTQNIAEDQSKRGEKHHNGGNYENHEFDDVHIKERHDDTPKDSKNEEQKHNKDKEKKKVAPLEHLAVTAYGEPGEKWKVLGYSETTGYPIIDLSELGINNEKVAIAPAPVKSQTELEDKQKPHSRSGKLQGTDSLKKPASNPEKSRLHAEFLRNINFFEKNYEAKDSTQSHNGRNHQKMNRFSTSLHSKLHRTHLSKEETVRSILYPTKKSQKYRVESRRRRMQHFLNLRMKPEPKGKYDIRRLDLEKLMDIIVTDAALLIFKHVRDLPSLPLIYECKVGIMFRLFKILSGFQSIVRYHGKRLTKTGEPDRSSLSQFLENLGKKILKWILGIRPSKPSIEGVARTLEHDLTMLQVDLPHLTDRECEGEMDEQDWDNFNFHYNFLLNLGKGPDKRKFWGRRTNKGKKD